MTKRKHSLIRFLGSIRPGSTLASASSSSSQPATAVPRSVRRWRALRRVISRSLLVAGLMPLLWLGASTVEWSTGRRILPWNPYAKCGSSQAQALPPTVRVGLYEEFPNPWRLARLRQLNFPVTLAVAAPSRAAFLELRATILHEYPQVREVYFWPLLTYDEGYYPGTWSSAEAVQRVAHEAEGLPALWDLEMPLGITRPSFESWSRNRSFLKGWLHERKEPVHIWRTHTTMGLDPLFLRLMGMHFDPLEYPAVSLHLDLYATGTGLPEGQMARVLRCGVERYGQRFIPSLGVLDDGEGPKSGFVPAETLRRNLELARAAGVAEVWLFGVNGLNETVLTTLHETLPLESLHHGNR